MVDIVGGSSSSGLPGRILTREDLYAELGISSTQTDAEQAMVDSAINRAEAAVRSHLRYDPVKATRTEIYPRTPPNYSGRDVLWEAEGNQAVLRRREEASTNEIQLQHIPLRADVTPRVWIDYDGRFGTSGSAFAAGDEKTIGTDFWPDYEAYDDAGDQICRAGILRSFGRWPSEPGSVKVTYSAGYTDSEFRGQLSLVDASPIFNACLLEATRFAKRSLAAFAKKTKIGHAPGYLQSENLGSYSYSLGASFADQYMRSNGLMAESREMLQSFLNYGIMHL